MPTGSKFDLATFDYMALTPDERDRIMRAAVVRAHVERAEAVRAAFGRLFAVLRRVAVRLRNSHRERRAQQRAVAALHGLNDHELKDIGLRRAMVLR